MIPERISFSVSQMAQSIADAGVSLGVVVNSPLGMMVNSMYDPVLAGETIILDGQVAGHSLDTPEKVAECIASASTTTNLAGMCLHDETKETIETAAANSILSILHLARNKATPMVNSVFTDVEKNIETIRKGFYLKINVVEDNLEDVFSVPQFVAMAGRHEGQAYFDVNVVRVFPTISEDELREAVKTGSAGFDSAVNALLEGPGIEILKNVYMDLFSVNSTAGWKKLADSFNVAHRTRVEVLFAWLLAKKFAGQIPDGVRGITDAAYTTYMGQLVEQLGRLITFILKRRADQIKLGLVVVNYPASAHSGNIVVNPVVYKEWLTKGGDPETLIGALAAEGGNKAPMDADTLSANEARYKRAFHEHAAMLKSQEMNQYFETVIRSLRQSVTHAILDADEEMLGDTTKDAYIKELNDHLRSISPDQIDNIYGVVRTLVCRMFFAGTDVEAVLMEIDKVGEKYKGIDPREAATIATANIVARWIVGQITNSSGPTQ